MPKLPPPKPKKPLKPPAKTLTERVADAADREGVYAMDLIRYPEALARQGITEQVSHSIAQEADQLNRQELQKLKARYERKIEDPYANATES